MPTRTRTRTRTIKSASPLAMSGAQVQKAIKTKNASQKEMQRISNLSNNFFKLPYSTSRNIVVLDALGFDDPEYRNALSIHKFKNPHGNNYVTDICTKGAGGCPICDGELTGGNYNRPSFVALFSVIEYDSKGLYQNKKTGELVKFQRRILSVKAEADDASAWLDVLSTQSYGKHGSLRGAVITAKRGAGNTSLAIGQPSVQGGKVIRGFWNEEQLKSKFSHPEFKNQSGEVYMQANEMLEPYDFQELFLSTETGDYQNDLRRRWGLEPIDAASSDHNLSESDGFDDFDDFDDEASSEPLNESDGFDDFDDDGAGVAGDGFDDFDDDGAGVAGDGGDVAGDGGDVAGDGGDVAGDGGDVDFDDDIPF